jgi:hypothetical protein
MDNQLIWPGDHWSTEGRGISGWANEHLTKTPKGSHTKEFHFGLIGDPVLNAAGEFCDFETRESIKKGPSTLRFFERNWNKQVKLYRLPGITREENLRMLRSISNIGMKGYGFQDFSQAAQDVVCLCIGMQFPPYTASQFSTSANDDYICTEIPAYAANFVYQPVEPPDCPKCWDIPVLYLQAIEEGRDTSYYKGMGKDLYYLVTGETVLRMD